MNQKIPHSTSPCLAKFNSAHIFHNSQLHRNNIESSNKMVEAQSVKVTVMEVDIKN